MSMNSNNKLTLFIYRTILRQCEFFDKNPGYKHYFKTPKPLQGKLPTYYTPSIPFTQTFKAVFREINNESKNYIDSATPLHSLGFNIIKNLNLATTFMIKSSNTEDEIRSLKQLVTENKGGTSLAAYQFSKFLQKQQKQMNEAVNINSNNNNNNNNNNKSLEETVVDSKNTIGKKNKKTNTRKKKVESENDFQVIDIKKENIKPGTLLISHPSNDFFYKIYSFDYSCYWR
ncbi:hypothetical protein DLAC_11510 [Tieghemostelium lacteum]|uniref:Uncharacterized protein n=1 Tax=Tieghemostelium lacteum TaxID=361077 RepID=A0A152A507_TIELA|nr:hypothetical protein DLAC_11510 [Tieghemostelium lacteum]|eukprot:KYR01304.1 hypothetical protein DLAC_11510 [Tieghemostelium lacteum]